MPVIISGMLSVFLLTMLLNSDSAIPMFAKFLLASLPTSLTITYIVVLRSRKPPRFDLIYLRPGSTADRFSRYAPNRGIHSFPIDD
jgi:hypothetical protein